MRRQTFIFDHKFQINVKFHDVQPDQNMMKPELSGIHMNFSFEVSSYSGQTVYRHIDCNMIHFDFAYVSQIWSMLTSTQI